MLRQPVTCGNTHEYSGEFLRVMSSGGSRAPCPRLVVRACADTRARTNKGAGGSEGARARVDRAAQVAISGGRAHSGPAEREFNG